MAFVLVALALTVVIQQREIHQLKRSNEAWRAAYSKQGIKLHKYVKWYWDLLFHNPPDD